MTSNGHKPNGNGAVPTTLGDSATRRPATQISVRKQYIKDLSFKNPGSPKSLTDVTVPHEIKIDVNVVAQPFGDNLHEVVLRVSCAAKHNDDTLFLVELAYGGLFALGNTPRERVPFVCMVECAHLLFPFARQVVAETTLGGGFPALFLDPLDFVQVYRQQHKPTPVPGGPALPRA